MKAIIYFVVLITSFFPTPVTALTRTEAYELARGGDADALEIAFTAHQDAFNASEIGPNTYQGPYSVFWTTEPLVEATIEGWRAAYPDSPQAAAAAAIRLRHVGLLVRGDDYVHKTPTAALTEFGRIAREALALSKSALDAEPRHLAAAYSLLALGAYLGSTEDRDRGFLIVEKLDNPADVLLSGLPYNYARWGGGPEATRLFCEERVPLVPDISVEDCMAKADYDHGSKDPSLFKSAIATLSQGSIDHFVEQHIAALSSGGQLEEAYALAKSRNFMNYQLAYALANGLGRKDIIDEFIANNLREDPLNPTDLTIYGDSQAEQGNLDAAWEAMDKALLYGRYSSFVRMRRVFLMMRDPERKWDLLDEIVRATDDRDGDIEILSSVLFPLMNPDELFLRHKDGAPRQEFECTRLQLFERHKQECTTNPQHYSCQAGTVAMRDTQIIEGRAKNVCGEATGRTWQDIVRHFLNLTEE